MNTSAFAAKRLARRAYADRMAERQFVREVLARKATPEVEASLAAAAQRSHQARNAAFLERFRTKAVAAAA
jgi:hypothetical protein